MEKAEGSISTAANAIEAVSIVTKNFGRNPNLVQIVLSDWKMPDVRRSIDKKALLDTAEVITTDIPQVVTGTDLTDYLRWTFAGRRIGSLIVTAYADNENLRSTREKGVYEMLSKPVKYTGEDGLVHTTLRLLETIFSREAPLKRELTDTFVARQITNEKDLLDYFILRYGIYDLMNYLQQKNPKRLDIDKFDNYSIPFGAFVKNREGSEKIVAALRIVTKEVQEQYRRMIQKILKENETLVQLVDSKIDQQVIRTLQDFVNLKRYEEFPVAESFKIQHHLEEYNKAGISYGEFSRIIDHPDYRGYGLSKLLILTAIAYCKMNNGPQMVFGACVPQHVAMYSKYGWKVIKDTGLVLEEKVQQVARGMVCDVFTGIVGPYNSIIEQQIMHRLQKDRAIAYPFSTTTLCYE